MDKPHLLHLFNAFEVGGVERQHMMLLEGLTDKYEQICWSYCHGPLEAEMDALGIAHQVGGVSTLSAMIFENKPHGIVMRTNRYMDEIRDLLVRAGLPVVYIKDYLRWFDGNGTFIDPTRDRVAFSFANAAFYCGPSLAQAFEGFQGPAELMYNGLDLSKFPLCVRDAPANKDRLRVGIVGNLCKRKNQLAAIKAFEPALLSGDFRLELAGAPADPVYAETLRHICRDLPVTLHGYVADPVAFLSQIDIFLLTSTMEGWPVSIMEAMACGVPVIAPDITDIAILLDHGNAGQLYPVAAYDTVLEQIGCLSHGKLYKSMSEKGLQYVHKFDIHMAQNQLADALDRLM